MNTLPGISIDKKYAVVNITLKLVCTLVKFENIVSIGNKHAVTKEVENIILIV